MPFTEIISTRDLAKHLDEPNWLVFDSRFDLIDEEIGREDYQEAHIPGALYVHLEHDLSAARHPGKTGRHPLPSVEEFSRRLSAWGVDSSVQAVVYDDRGGMVAARLWWMLRWLGHDNVAVLEGGWQRWQEENRPDDSYIPTPRPRQFVANPRGEWVVRAEEIVARLADNTLTLLDARSADRYRGENETLDPVAGHIPGAINAPFTRNLDSDGSFHSRENLRQYYETLVGHVPAKEVIVYCGSGVSAAHDALAMAYAGIGDVRLYVDSWSHWITDSRHPVVTGERAR